MIFPPSFSWPRYLASARALLAAASLVAFYRSVPGSPALLYAILASYLVFTLALLVRGCAHTGTMGLLVLFADTVFLLVLSGYGGESVSWLLVIVMLLVLTEALVFHGPLEVALVTAVVAASSFAIPDSGLRNGRRAVVVAGALACGFAVNKRRQAAQIDSLQAQLREAAEAAAKAGEFERQRIASDFHDGPLQSFISLQMRLEILRKLLERDLQAGMDDLKQLQGLAQTQIRDLRAFLHSMRPVDVDGANLMATARRTADAFQKESGIPVSFVGANTPVGLPREMTTEVLQMLREALHNVQKHAGATRVAVAMEKTERGLEISVDDNGHGFSFAGTYTLEEMELLRLGPVSLKRRARSLNAEMLLESRPGIGAGLRFRIPLQ